MRVLEAMGNRAKRFGMAKPMNGASGAIWESARAITAGGESGDPSSPHFRDQAERFASGDLREVYFYREQLRGHTEREYRPGG